jgi:hypothetical protein
VIFVGGINQSIEREAHDRLSIQFPTIQLNLLQQLEKVVRSPIHVVIMSGGGVDLSYIRDSDQYGSLLWMGYGGQSAGTALVNVMFGQYNPGGRLPITYYPASYTDQVPESDMQMRPSSTNPGRTYKFYTGKPVFEFGYGLSYTTFSYSWDNQTTNSIISIESLMKKRSIENKLVVHLYRVNVTNTGDMAGSDVVLAFITPPQQSLHDPSPPIKKLFGFQRVYLDINETIGIYFPFDIQSLLTIALDGSKWLEPGSHQIIIGKQHMHTIHLEGEPIRWSSI